MAEVKKVIWFIFFSILLVLILDRANQVKEIEGSSVSALDTFINTLRTPPPAAASSK